MPTRHMNTFGLKSNTGHTQSECSQPSTTDELRAPPAVPGRIPLRDEAELLQGVTKASAEPLTGAILFGPPQVASKPLDFSLVPPEVDDRNSRARGMGHKPDGDSHPSSISVNPLRNNNNHDKSLLISAPSPPGGTPIERQLTLATSGTDPTTNDVYGSSVREVDERQEGAKETTNSDTIKPSYFNHSVSLDNNVSHSTLFPDKSYKTSQNISLAYHNSLRTKFVICHAYVSSQICGR